jgi:hypothetical protein
MLQTALGAREVWTAALPPGRAMVESLKSLAADETAVVLHPIGTVQVRQKVLPLGLKLQKLGNAPISGFNQFAITRLEMGGGTDFVDLQAEPVEDHFARGQFVDLNEKDRLSVPSFENLTAGAGASSHAFKVTGAARSCKLAYKSLVVGEADPPAAAVGHLEAQVAQQSLQSAAVQRTSTRKTGVTGYTANKAASKVKVTEHRYRVVGPDLKPLAEKDVPGNQGAMSRIQADEALAACAARKPALAGKLMVVPDRDGDRDRKQATA